MKGIVFALPPLSEQERILGVVDEQTEELGRVVQQARREIDLLREFRTRLIADIVTGKVDVREAATGLSESLEEPEAFDEDESHSDSEEAGEAGDDVAAEAEE
jgi:type I restriction enzyme S subunit